MLLAYACQATTPKKSEACGGGKPVLQIVSYTLRRYCGNRAGLTIDHVVPLSKGGKWVWENLVTACSKCNGKKGSKSLKQLGWSLKQRPKVCCALCGHKWPALRMGKRLS